MGGKNAQMPIGCQASLQGPYLIVPPLATQQAIVAEIEAEQALVAANRELITRFEKKIQSALARILGEESGSANGAPPSQPGATTQEHRPKSHEG